MGGLIPGWAYKRNKKNVSERLVKKYLRNELKHFYSKWAYKRGAYIQVGLYPE